jgi:hypothetical protein
MQDTGGSIGGWLSHNFRKLLLAIAAANMCWLFLPREYSGNYQLGSDLLGIVEVTGLTFLCFLTPYVLLACSVDFLISSIFVQVRVYESRFTSLSF